MSERLVERFFAAVEAGDLETIEAIYAPDALIWHNDDLREQPVRENLKMLSGLHRVVSRPRYEIVRRVAVDGGVYQQYVLRGRLPDGSEVAVHAAMYLAVSGDRITRIEEYLDSAQVARLRAARATQT